MDLSLAEFVILILAASGLWVFACGAISRFLHYRDERAAVRDRIICRLCLSPFPRPDGQPPVVCPVCKAVNDPGRDGLKG